MAVEKDIAVRISLGGKGIFGFEGKRKCRGKSCLFFCLCLKCFCSLEGSSEVVISFPKLGVTHADVGMRDERGDFSA